MNKFFRVIWCNARQAYVVTHEKACSFGKPVTSASAAVVVALFMLSATARAADLPTGGQIVGGSGSIATSGNTMTVTQTTDRMAADWQSFNIGKGNTVNFVQPNSNSVALNRVLGSDVSVIQGALNANGKLFLVNPNGVIFSKDAQVNVGSIVASTLNISTNDFMAGSYRFEGQSSNAIVNQGNIIAHGDGSGGGTVALIAAKIVNEGSMAAHKGNVLMGAGSRVTLNLGGPVSIEVEQGAIDALIEQGGAIKADGGLVYLSAKAAGDLTSTVINHTGITEAQTLAMGESGEIYLMGDMEKGRIEVAGTLDASAPNGGDGGFIETSAANVQIQDGIQVTTKSSFGKTGEWLIDPVDITIASSGGNVTGGAIATALQTSNVTLDTAGAGTCTGVGCGALGGTNGDIFVKDNIQVSGGTQTTTLTLKANRDIIVDPNKTISRTGAYGLNVVFWSDSDGNESGYIRLQEGVIIQTNDGHIWMGGGSSSTWNGLTGPSSAAHGVYSGINTSGLHIVGTTLNAGGGDMRLTANGEFGIRLIDDGGIDTRLFARDIELSGIGETRGVSLTIETGSSAVVDIEATRNLLISGATTGGGGGVRALGVGGNSIRLTSGRTVEINANTFIADSTLLITSQTLQLEGSGTDYSLINTGNDVATLTASAGSVSYIDRNSLRLGEITLTGKLNVATITGNLTIGGNLSAGSTASDAIVLNAGRSSSAGTSAGGDITYDSGSVSTGAGGRATLFTGSFSGSTRLSALVGAGSERARFNSDESKTNYTVPLGSGIFAIYRERQSPIATTAVSQTQSASSNIWGSTANQPASSRPPSQPPRLRMVNVTLPGPFPMTISMPVFDSMGGLSFVDMGASSLQGLGAVGPSMTGPMFSGGTDLWGGMNVFVQGGGFFMPPSVPPFTFVPEFTPAPPR